MKKLISFALSVIMLISLVSVTSFADTEPPADTIKYISNLQNSIPPAIPAQKVQLAWLAAGAGNTIENYARPGDFTEETIAQFSYQFENHDGSLRGRVTGDNGDVRIFALRTDINTRNNHPVHAYRQVGTASSLPYEIAVYEFAMQFVQHFDTITAVGHDHGNHTAHRPDTIRESAERFPLDNSRSVVTATSLGTLNEDTIVFTYSRDDLGGMMSAMIHSGEVKHISNLQNNIPAPLPAAKRQLAWIAAGAGNSVANYANTNWTADGDNQLTQLQFSYEFVCNDGVLKGRVQGDNGTVRIFALRNDVNTARNNLANNTYAEVRKEGESYFRGATGTTAATAYEIAVYDFAVQYTRHFATITATGHDHGNHTTFKPDTIRESAERFPFETGIVAATNPEQSIVFTYSRDDLGGLMNAMVLTESDDCGDPECTDFTFTIKHITNLQNSIPAAIPAQKVQLAWIARGAGNIDANFAANGETSANFTNASNNGTFSYQFENAGGTLKGRVTGENGTVRIFALRTDINTRNNLPVHTYREVTSASTLAYEKEVYEFAYQYTQHFDTITEFQHDHVNHTTFKPDTIRESAERFPFERGISAVENPEKTIVFTYSRDDLGGMMNAMVLTPAPSSGGNNNTNTPARRPSGGGGSGSTTATTPTITIATTPTGVLSTALNALNISTNIPVRQLTVPAGATGNQSVSVGAAFAGQNAILVRYNAQTEQLEFVSAATIGANGNVNINVAQTGDFLVLTFKSGDITGTGTIDTGDALALLRHVAGISELNSIQLFVANGKAGDVGSGDALNILRVVAGIIPDVETAPAAAPSSLVNAHDLPAFDRGTGGSSSSSGGSWCDDCGAYH